MIFDSSLLMKWTRSAPIFGIILLAVFSCTNVKDPVFKHLDNFRVKNFGLQQTTIGFNVTYYNPNNFGVTVKEAEADIYLDTVYLGKFTQDQEVYVDKNADFSLPLSGGIPLQKALEINLKNIGSRDILLKADGSVKVGKAGLFINKEVHYQGKHRLDQLKF
jgi:LEA14-like dessication related protein